MNKYEKMWEQMKNSLWKCYWEKNNKTVRCADVLYMMRMVEKEINTREEAKADSGREYQMHDVTIRKKAMISQQMNGLTHEEIQAKCIKLERMGYEVVNQYLGQCEAINPIACLARSIDTMSECQAVYFCDGWEDYRGCRIEHEVAENYGLECIYEGKETL